MSPKAAVEVSEYARAELAEAIAYIARTSPANASRVRAAVVGTVERLRTFPEAAPIDTDAPEIPGWSALRVAHTSGFRIHYALGSGERRVVRIIAILRAARLPIAKSAYGLRFLRELVAQYQRALQRAS